MARWRDIDLEFRRDPASGDVQALEDERAVVARAARLIDARAHDVLFHPEVRCSLKDLLFEEATPDVVFKWRKLILSVLREERRVEFTDVEVEQVERRRVAFRVRYRRADGTEASTVVRLRRTA